VGYGTGHAVSASKLDWQAPCGGGYKSAVDTWMNRNVHYSNASEVTFCYDWNTIWNESYFQLLSDIPWRIRVGSVELRPAIANRSRGRNGKATRSIGGKDVAHPRKGVPDFE
jgi:hypothetical protein